MEVRVTKQHPQFNEDSVVRFPPKPVSPKAPLIPYYPGAFKAPELGRGQNDARDQTLLIPSYLPLTTGQRALLWCQANGLLLGLIGAFSLWVFLGAAALSVFSGAQLIPAQP